MAVKIAIDRAWRRWLPNWQGGNLLLDVSLKDTCVLTLRATQATLSGCQRCCGFETHYCCQPV